MKKLFTVLCLLLVAAVLFAGGKKEKIVIKSADDLVGRKIGVQSGTTGELYATEEIKDAKVVPFKTGMDAALDLKNGAIDLIVLDELPAKEIVKRNSDLMIVDLDLAIEESSQNPVFYVQYAYARICSMMNVLKGDGYTPLSPDRVDFSLLDKEEELDLINHLNALPEEVIEVARTLDPSRLTRYIIELATLFHRFYNAHRVRVEDEALLHARLKLVEAVRIAMGNVLGMLKITAPEKM